jgi:hypothetical protein
MREKRTEMKHQVATPDVDKPKLPAKIQFWLFLRTPLSFNYHTQPNDTPKTPDESKTIYFYSGSKNNTRTFLIIFIRNVNDAVLSFICIVCNKFHPLIPWQIDFKLLGLSA